MSWFRHKPPKYPPVPPHTSPYHSSPATDRLLKETKEKVRPISSSTKKKQ